MAVFYLQSRLLGIPDPLSLPPFRPSIPLSFLPSSLPPFLPSISSHPKLDGEEKRKNCLSPWGWQQENSRTGLSERLAARRADGIREKLGLWWLRLQKSLFSFPPRKEELRRRLCFYVFSIESLPFSVLGFYGYKASSSTKLVAKPQLSPLKI